MNLAWEMAEYGMLGGALYVVVFLLPVALFGIFTGKNVPWR